MCKCNGRVWNCCCCGAYVQQGALSARIARGVLCAHVRMKEKMQWWLFNCFVFIHCAHLQRKRAYAVRHVHRAFCRMGNIRQPHRSIQRDRRCRRCPRRARRPWNCNRWSNAKPNWTDCWTIKIICCINCAEKRLNCLAAIRHRMERVWNRWMAVWIRCVGGWTQASNYPRIYWTMAKRMMWINCFWPNKFNSKYRRPRWKWPMTHRKPR